MYRTWLILFLFGISTGIHALLPAQSLNPANKSYPLKAQPADHSQHEKQIKIDFLRVDDGLSQGNIYAIAQDKNGFMWFGAQDGLNKYDGYRFTVYRHDLKNPYSISKNFIIRIVADPRGFLWIAYTDLTMDIFDPETERAYKLRDPKDNREIKIVRGMLFNDSSGICYNSDGIKLLKFRVEYNPDRIGSEIKVQPEDVTAYLPEKTSDSNSCHIFISSKNKMYVSYCDSVFVYPGADITHSVKAEKYSHNYFSQKRSGTRIRTDWEVICAEDKVRHRLVSASNNSFTIFDEQTGIKSDSAIITTGNYYTDVDLQGRIWILSGGELVYDPVHRKLTKLIPDDSKIGKEVWQSINSFFSDKGGTIWMGTSGYGIFKYNLATERFVTIRNEGERFSISRMWDDTHADKLWMRSYGGTRPFLFDKSLQRLVAIPGSVTTKINKAFAMSKNPTQEITGLCTDDNGYWLTLDSTVIYADKNLDVLNRIKVNNGLTYWEVKMIADNTGNLWITTGLGKNYILRKFNKDTNKEINTFPFPVSEQAHGYPFALCIMPGENNNLYLGTLDGLFIFNTDSEKWNHYMHREKDSTSLPSNDISTLCNDMVSENILWIGTNGSGLVKFDKTTGKCVTFTTADGLPNNVIYGILQDKQGNIWMSTNNGLSRYSPQTNSFKNFNAKDGLQGNEFNRFAYCKMQTGEMAFGGLNGFTVFDPDELVDNPYQPYILFTGFKIGNKEVTMGSNDSLLNKVIFATKEVHLVYSQNFITFGFTSSDYSSIEKNRFQYQLVGLDNDWQPATKLNEATYTNLDPGTYTFKVRGTNSDGVWSPNEASINIFISPPWWATWWFHLLVAIALAASVYSLYRYRLKQFLKMQSLRNRIASDLHDEIGSTLSSISLFGEVARKNINNNPVKTDNLLEQINESTSAMMDSMGDIVWTINTRNDNFDNLINRMRAFSSKVMETREVNFVFNAPVTGAIGHLDMTQRKNVYLIFKEAVNNAAKYSSCKNLIIDITDENGLLKVCIKDDGNGFDTEALLINSTSGNGLINMKKRAEELKGSLEINSNSGAGTSIELTVKI